MGIPQDPPPPQPEKKKEKRREKKKEGRTLEGPREERAGAEDPEETKEAQEKGPEESEA